MSKQEAITLWARRTGLVAAGIVFLAVVLFVQHKRHGWPFSLHHGMQAATAKAGAAHSQGHGASAASANTHARANVQFDPAKLETIGVTFEEARSGTVAQPIRAVATVVPDESRVSHIHTRVAGWIEKLHINTTGQKVKAGQPLAGIFSQELFASQVEFLSAVKAAREGPASIVASSARTRLKLFGMTDAEIQAIERRGSPERLVTIVAPRTGVVLRRGVALGTAVDPSTELMTVADLSQVWVLAEVSEAESGGIRVGTRGLLDFSASGRKPFEAPVEFVYPTLTEKTRTLRVRFSVPNQDQTIRPGLYGTAEFRLEPRQTLTVSRDAVVDTGTQQHVFVVTGPGQFEPRPVALGARLADRVEVRDGLREGEKVVASGVFLIDSESRLRASGGGTGHVGHGGGGSTHSSDKDEAPRENGPSGHEGHGGGGEAPTNGSARPSGHEGHGREPAPNPHQGHGG